MSPQKRGAVLDRLVGLTRRPDADRCTRPAMASIATHVVWFTLDSVSTSQAVTRSIRVEVTSRYSPEHSDPRKAQWFFLYTITIVNESSMTVQLLNRHWIIMDATGNTEEVRGPGVIGAQPLIRPGERFEYTSGCPLKTPFGSMRGDYEMVTASGERFFVTVAPFTLRRPGTVN